MKIIKLSIPVMLLLLFTGCGTHNWKHYTIPENQWEEDYRNCLQESETAAGGIRVDDPRTQPIKTGEIRYLMEKCMKAKGYYR